MDEKTLSEIEARRRVLPAKLHVVNSDDQWHYDWPDFAKSDDDRHASTVSPDPTRNGWENDSGYGGYGLPLPVAEALAALPEDVDALLAEVRRLRTVEAAAKAMPDRCTWCRSPFDHEALRAALKNT